MATEPGAQEKEPMNDDARKAAHGTIANILVRLLSFFCTQQAFRLMDENVGALGKASIQLELLLTTVLFLSREGFRLSLTRELDTHNENVAWLTIPTATVAAAAALAWHLSSESSLKDEDYRLGGILFAIAAWVEAMAEPAVLYWMRLMDVTTRSSAEGLATLCKTFATVLALKRWLPDWPVFAFGVAQLCYAMVYFLVLYVRTWSKLIFSLQGAFHPRTCYMTIIFTFQGVFKHLLTEGDRIILSTLSGSYDQGVYAMGSAYGGLAARFLLQPLEENARLLWSRLQSTKGAGSCDRIEQSYLVLVKVVLYIGFTFSFLATNYTSILLNVLAGRKWGSNDEAIAALSAFCIYTAFLALNGMTEAFVFGVASSGREVGSMGIMHTSVGVVFAVIAPIFVARFGTLGLVAASCISMMLRSLYSVHFAASYFAKRRLEEGKPAKSSHLQYLIIQMLPHWLVMFGFIMSAAATNGSLQWFRSQDVFVGGMDWMILALQHIAVGAVCFLGIIATAYSMESDFRYSIQQLLRPTEKSKED